MKKLKNIAEEKLLPLNKTNVGNDDYYRKLFENGREVLAVVDQQTVIQYISATVEQEFGYKPEELVGRRGFDFIHKKDLDDLESKFDVLGETPGEKLQTTFRFKHKDGTWSYVENHSRNLLEDKDIKGIVVNFRNVSTYISNRLKISHKEHYYRSLIENSSDIISIIDTHGRYKYLSPSFNKQFGHYALDFIGEDAFQYMHPDDREEVRRLFEKAKEVNGWQMVIDKVYRVPDSTGAWRYLASAVHNLINDPVIEGIVINTRIVDDEIRILQRLKAREKYYRTLIENSMDLIAVRDENAIITYCSPSTETILGYNEAELIGTTGFQLIHPDDALAADKDWEYLMTNPGRVLRLEQRIRRKDGTWLDIEARVMNLLHVEEVSGVVSNFSDITQRKEGERIQKRYKETLEKEVSNKTQQLKQQNEVLGKALERLKNTQVQLVNAEKMASLGQLTAGIAHEINNPINFVSGNVHPLKMDFQDLKKILHKFHQISNAKDKLAALKVFEKEASELDIDYLFEEMEALIDGIEEGAKRTKDIVTGLRNFSRLDEDIVKSTNVHQGLDATLVILKNERKKGEIKIEKCYDISIGEIECYPGKLNQVFMNLLSNAIHAIQGKGTVTITTSNGKEHVRISIKDDGMGMSKAIQEKIFEPFFTTKEVGEGTGLGLSITYGIIEQHYGKIIVNSEQGKGSELVVILPKVMPKHL